MFDLGWTELLVVGIVALIVVGPKDLPVLFRNVGRFVGKAKGMAREFSRAMNDAADDAGVNDLGKTIKSATDPVNSALDGVKKATSSYKDWDPGTETGKLAIERQEKMRKLAEEASNKAALKKAAEVRAAREAGDGGEAGTKAKADAKPAARKAAKPAKAKTAKAKPAAKKAAAPTKSKTAKAKAGAKAKTAKAPETDKT